MLIGFVHRLCGLGQVQVRTSANKLLVLDVHTFERFLFFELPYCRQVANFVGKSVRKDKIIMPRPYMHDLLKFCMENHFDLAFFNCDKHSQDRDLMKALFTDKEFWYVHWIQTHPVYHNTVKGIFLEHLFPIYMRYWNRENVVVLDVSPHRTCFNPFYSSLYLPQFAADPNDDFLHTSLIPFLRILAASNSSLEQTIRQNYPEWSSAALRLDWKLHKNIWKGQEFQEYGDSGHLSRFRDRRSA